MPYITAWDEFRDLAGREYVSGVMRWGRGARADEPIREGDELRPYESVGSVECGDDDDGVSMDISMESFGTVRRLLVADGEAVRPGQALLEFDERPPTIEEWEEQWDRASTAEQRARELQALPPRSALRRAVRHRYGVG